MRRSLTAAVVAGIGIVALSGSSGAVGAGHDDDASSRGRVVRFDVAFTSGFFMLDFGPTGVREVSSFQDPVISPSRGDQIVFEDTLLRDGEEVAAGGGSCTVTALVPADPPIRLHCTATYELPGGQVAVQGRATNAPTKKLAIVGGTGRYVGAGGEFTLTELGDGTGTAVFRFARR